MLVKILGTGCTNCKMLEKRVRDVISNNNIEAEVAKITEIQDIMSYNILRTPGLVINETVKCSGVIPKEELILKWLNEELK